MYTYTVTKEVKMRRIGIIGGMSYESTLHYYERINRQVNERVGGPSVRRPGTPKRKL